MIDERFSAASFASRGIDTESARELAHLLSDEIQSSLHQTILQYLVAIIERLNSLGHNLKPEYEPGPGDFSYREDWTDEAGYHCKLRVGVDLVVSTGYGHLSSDAEILSE